MSEKNEGPSVDRAREAIRGAFRERKPPFTICGSSKARVDEDEELQNLERDFKGVDWTQINAETILAHAADLPLFSAEAFQHFIPAYMLAALEPGAQDNQVFYTVLALSPVRDDGKLSSFITKRLEGFNRRQRNAVISFLEAVVAGPADFYNKEAAEAALKTYWNQERGN